MSDIVQGLLLTLSPTTLIAILIGSIGGGIIGALPGLSSTLGVALLIPFTFGLQPAVAMGLLGGMYCSSIYGGSITAILINTPGTGAAAATCLDGYPMTKAGKAGKALYIAIMASFFGGMFSTVALLLIAPQLAKVALRFGPPETFVLSIFGLSIISSVSGKNLAKGLIAGLIGLLLSTIGFDLISGYPRFAFGNINLYEGVDLIIVLVGFFSIPEALMLIKKKQQKVEDIKMESAFKDIRFTKEERKVLFPVCLKSAFIGTFIGIIPGVGTPVACFVSYNEAKRSSKHPDAFGTGIIEGVAAPETANNAVSGGSFVPLLTLGIPGSAQTAVYLGALLILGIQPGPELFSNQGPIAYSIVFGLIAANIFMLLIGLFGIKYFVKVIKIPSAILIPIILTFTVIGSFAIHNSIFDVLAMCALGFLGYILRLNEVPLAPIVLAKILGPIGEQALIQTLSITHGNILIIFTRPICLVLLIITVASVYFSRKKSKITE